MDELFSPLNSVERSLIDNITHMNSLTERIISTEFYKLFSKFDIPTITFTGIIQFVWNNIGGGAKFVICLLFTSIILGSKFLFLLSYINLKSDLLLLL